MNTSASTAGVDALVATSAGPFSPSSPTPTMNARVRRDADRLEPSAVILIALTWRRGHHGPAETTTGAASYDEALKRGGPWIAP